MVLTLQPNLVHFVIDFFYYFISQIQWHFGWQKKKKSITTRQQQSVPEIPVKTLIQKYVYGSSMVELTCEYLYGEAEVERWREQGSLKIKAKRKMKQKFWMKCYMDYEFMRNKAVFILISSLSFLNAFIYVCGRVFICMEFRRQPEWICPLLTPCRSQESNSVIRFGGKCLNP